MDEEYVTIYVGSRNYKIHKSMLTDCSSYFQAMFDGRFREGNENKVRLEGIEPETWERILYFLRYGKVEEGDYSPDCYKIHLRLIEAASMYNFLLLKEVCAHLIYYALKVENALETYQVVSKLDMEHLISKARGLLFWNVKEITCSVTFLDLPAQEVEKYLSDPAAHCSTGEMGIWKAVDRWINSTLDFEFPRVDFLPNLIKCVSLKELTAIDLRTISLSENVRSHPLVSSALAVLIEENSNHRQGNSSGEEERRIRRHAENRGVSADEVRAFIESWRLKPPRKLPFVPAMVQNVKMTGDVIVPHVIRFDEENKRLVPTIRLDASDPRVSQLDDYRVVQHDSKLYLLNGKLRNPKRWFRCVWEYDQIFRKWTLLMKLEKVVRFGTVCVLDGSLYIMGGYGEMNIPKTTVYKVSLAKRTWRECARLPTPNLSTPACTFRGHIYLFGKQVFQYAPDDDEWILLDIEVPRDTHFNNAMGNKDYMFVTAKDGAVYKFDVDLPSPRFEEIGRFTHKCISACLVNEDIYCFSKLVGIPVNDIYYEKINIRTGVNTVLWKEEERDRVVVIDENTHRGCFPFLFY